MKAKTNRIVISALMAALALIATIIIKIPSPLKGYINFGDCIVLLSGWMLTPAYGFLAAGIGSAFADVFLGYLPYAPVTFLIKGMMAVIAYYGFKFLHSKIGNLPSRIISGIVAEVIMVLGYFVFEGFLYGFAPSLVNIPANCIQGAAGLVIGVTMTKALERIKLSL